MNAQIEALRAVLPALPTHSQSFAASLLVQFDRKGDLSPKQWPYVAQLVEKAKPKPEPVKAQVGEMTGLVDLFETARSNGIQYPKISLDVDGETVVLSMAGNGSQYAGQINVASPGSFETRTWYGRVARNGEFTQSRNAGPAGLVSALALLAANPSLAGAAHGQRTGNCCFCARLLKTKRSLEVGYGPICAEKWGLNW